MTATDNKSWNINKLIAFFFYLKAKKQKGRKKNMKHNKKKDIGVTESPA
jgi:hypothetical protein